MKRYIIIMVLLTSVLLCHAQGRVGYAYDAAGNRISRTIILNRNMAKRQQAKAMDENTFSDKLSLREIRISPNPTKGLLRITITGLQDTDKCSLSVYTLKGQTIKTLPVTGEVTTIDLSGHPDGIYLLDITINGEKTSWKIIKN